jgi:lipopolysaccharide transport system ATP-binding protein
MNNTAIKVEKLSKCYQIGSAKDRNMTFREAITNMVKAPLRFMKNAFLKHPLENDEEDDYIWALKDVSFEVKRGEVVGVIGRNGAGKSTLLKILSRITEPTEGRVVLHGRVGSLLEVGTGFHSELTGEENIYLSGTILGMSSREISNKFDEIVAFAEMKKFINTPVKFYSSGMYMRLIDEVLAVGDAQFQKKCLGKMGDVAKEGRTVLFVSHNMVAVQSLCQKVILLDKGELVQNGPANLIVSNYLKYCLSSTQMDQIWDNKEEAPGCEEVRLHRIYNGDAIFDYCRVLE